MKTTATFKFLQKPMIGILMFLLMGSTAIGQIIFPPPIIKLYPPSFTKQPVSANFCYTDSRTYQKFIATVSSTTTVSYQWEYYYSPYVIFGKKSEELILPKAGWYPVTNGTYVAGATTATLTIYEPSGGWVKRSTSYRLKATNSIGTTTSTTVELNVHTKPSISTQPSGATIWYPGSHTFSVSASSTATPTYQWQKYSRGIYLNILKANGTSYTTSSSGTYRVAISNSYCGTTYSNTASLVFNGITSHPANQTICEDYSGTSVSFSVSGYSASKWQWQAQNPKTKLWTDIPGATSATYSYAKPGGGWKTLSVALRCRVTFPLGTQYSNTATFKVNNLPTFTKHPANASVNLGETATFSVTVSSTTAKTYQWYKDDVAISGATGTILTIPGVTLDDAGSYKCTVWNSCGSKTSNTAQLGVVKLDWPMEWFSQKNNNIPKNTLDMYAVSAPDKNTAWAVISTWDHRDSLVYTLDGGETWNWTSTGQESVYPWQSIFFTDNQHGWVCTYEKIGFTDNGGATWATWTDPALNDYFYDIHMVNNSKGWAVGDNGMIYYTVDGGNNWNPQSSGALSALYEVHFWDDQRGVAVGDAGTVVYTTNGGTTWSIADDVTISSTEIPSSLYLYNVYMVGPSTVYATSSTKFIKSVDGGATWSVVNDYRHGYDLSFINDTVGWVASSSGRIYYTKNGGTTWYEQTTGTSTSLKAITMVDAENGWAVGYDGALQRTAFGGCKLPRVNLYEDKVLCEGDNNTLRADTFDVSFARYEWSTGSTSGWINANTAGKYFVDVFNLCEHKATDTVEVTVNPLPEAYAGEDEEICDGDTIQLNASGGLFYSWTSGGKFLPPKGELKSAEATGVYISDPGIANPLVTSDPGTTTFTVTVEDGNGCVNDDDMVLTVYQVPTNDVSAPASVCRNIAASIAYSGTASAAGDYYWDFGDGVAVEGAPNNFSVTWDTTGEQTIRLAVNENGCFSDTAMISLAINPIPNSGFSMPEGICDSGNVQILYEGVDSLDADYIWDFDGGTNVNAAVDEGPYQISWNLAGTKTVSLQVNQSGCISEITSKQVVVSYPYESQDICLVTLDEETRKNAIIWEKGDSTGVLFYNIYRQSATGDTYDLLETMPVDTLSYYVDMTSEPESKSHKYRIAVWDTCDNESELSVYHKTMLLTTNLGPNSINLAWTEYEVEGTGFGFEYYIIRRGPSPTQLDSITTIPNDNISWPDNNPLDGDNFYQVVGVVSDPCSPSGRFKAGTGPYNHSLSNMDDNKLKETSVEDMLSGVTDLRVFPNPFSDKVNVEYYLEQASDVKIEVYNLLGVRVLEVENVRQIPGSHSYNIKADDLEGSSIYYLRFSVNNGSSVIKLIPAY